MTARAGGGVGGRPGHPRAAHRQDRRAGGRSEGRHGVRRSEERHGGGQGEARGGRGTLVRGGSDPVLVRVGDGRRAGGGRGSATSLPSSLSLERAIPGGRERPRSGAGQGRVVRAGRMRMDARRRVRQVMGGRDWRDGAGEAIQASRLVQAPTRSASLPTASLADLPHAHPQPSAPPLSSAPPTPPAALTSTQKHPTSANTQALGSGVDKAARGGRYGRSVSSLAAALRRDDRRHHHKTSRRRPDPDAKSRKYVAGSGGGCRQGPLAAAATYSHTLWRPVTHQPLPDPVKPRPHAPCCCSPAMTTAPCSSLLLLPLQLFLLALLLAYLIIGAYVFSALEDPMGEGGELVEVRRSTVTLPGTPRHPDMTKARQELVERLINISSNLILERSQEVVIAAIFTSSRLQSALQAFQQGGGSRLPPDKQLERLSRSVMTEWRQQIHHLAARYHTLITRHALGIQVDGEKRSAVWGDEEPPPPLPWRTSHALLHAFCLLTTVGGGVRAQTPGGRAAGVLFTLVGVLLYVAVVGVWAARLRDTAIIVIKMFSRKKIQARESKISPYHNMQQQQQQQHASKRLPSGAQSTSSSSLATTITNNISSSFPNTTSTIISTSTINTTTTTNTTTSTTTTTTTSTNNNTSTTNPSLLLHPHHYHPHYPYNNPHHHHHPYQPHHSLSTHPYHNPHARSALLLVFLITLYLVSVGTQAVAGETFWAGLENAIQALLCVHPPNPLPQDLSRITGFMAFTFFGHLLLALLLYDAKEWWWVWWRGRATPS